MKVLTSVQALFVTIVLLAAITVDPIRDSAGIRRGGGNVRLYRELLGKFVRDSAQAHKDVIDALGRLLGGYKFREAQRILESLLERLK